MTRLRLIAIWCGFLVAWTLVMAWAIGLIAEKCRTATGHANLHKRTMTRHLFRILDLESLTFREEYSRSPNDWGEFKAFIRRSPIDQEADRFLKG